MDSTNCNHESNNNHNGNEKEDGDQDEVDDMQDNHVDEAAAQLVALEVSHPKSHKSNHKGNHKSEKKKQENHHAITPQIPQETTKHPKLKQFTYIKVTNIPDSCKSCRATTSKTAMEKCHCTKEIEHLSLNLKIDYDERDHYFTYAENHLPHCPSFLAKGGVRTVRIEKPTNMPNFSRNEQKRMTNIQTFDVANLITVDLSCNTFDTFLSSIVLEQLASLTTLKYAVNYVEVIPEESLQVLASKGNLTELDLSYNRLQNFPMGICQIRSLRTLLLNHNKLFSIPSEFLQLTNLKMFDEDGNKTFDVDGNELSEPILQKDLNIIKDENKLSHITNQLQTLMEDESKNVLIKCTSLKLVFVGNQGAGKSTLARNLRRRFDNDNNGNGNNNNNNNNNNDGDTLTEDDRYIRIHILTYISIFIPT